MKQLEVKDSDLLQYQQLPFEYLFGIDVAIKKLRPNAAYVLEGTSFTAWQDSMNLPAPTWTEIIEQFSNDKQQADAWLQQNKPCNAIQSAGQELLSSWSMAINNCMQQSTHHNQSHVHGLFPTPVMKIDFDIPQIEKEFLMNLEMIASENPQQEIYNHLFSKDTYVLNCPQLLALRKQIENHINDFAGHVLGHRQPCIVTQSWVNQNKPGKAAHMHSHPNSIISGVLYIQVPTESGTIRFHKHMPNPTSNWTVYPETDNDLVAKSFYAWDWVDITTCSNELLLFPSYLPHSVNPNDSHSDRWSLAFNAVPKYRLCGARLDELDWTKIAARANEQE